MMLRLPRTYFLAVVDQSAFALSGLAVQAVVASSSSAADFGAFAVASCYLFFASLIQQTMILEPMFVFSGGRYRVSADIYHRTLLTIINAWFSVGVVCVGLSLASVIYLVGSSTLATCLAAQAVAAAPVLGLWLIRRVALQRGLPIVALISSAVYLAALIVLVSILWIGGGLAGWSVLMSTAVAAVSAGLVGGVVLNRHLSKGCVAESLTAFNYGLSGGVARHVVSTHYNYGRWALPSEIIGWMINNGPVLFLPLVFDLGSAAYMRILSLLYMPLQQCVAVAMTLMLRFQSSRANVDVRLNRANGAAVLLAGIVAVYGIGVVFFGGQIVKFFFGADYPTPMQHLLLSTASVGFITVFLPYVTALRSQERSGVVLGLNMLAGAVFSVALLWLISFGVPGVLISQSIAWMVTLPVAYWAVWRICRGSAQ